jgi:hypothetical protein
MPGYGSTGFRQFLDRLILHGLEHVGLYYSTYRAVVVSNEDPENEGDPDPQGRLRVRVPAFGDTSDVERLAYPIAPLAGAQHGFKFLPEAGDQVYVECENGRPDIILWKGGWWAKGEIPEDFKGAKAHGWFTRRGHHILLDETDGEEVLRIRHLSGSEICFDKDGNISIRNVSGKLVEVGLDADEAAAKGDTLKGLLDELFDAIAALTVTTHVGPSGPPINIAQFQSIKARLGTFLSQTVRVK